MVTEKLNQVIEELEEDSIIFPPEKFNNQIPTLQKGVYREISPMLLERFNRLGAWKDATHGDWLSLSEMKKLWDDEANLDKRILGIKKNLIANSDNWENDAVSLFKSHRISVFAGSEYTNERIYLLWFDNVVEPEFWVYDINGFSRFKNFKEYLISYIDDDLEDNYEWILALK